MGQKHDVLTVGSDHAHLARHQVTEPLELGVIEPSFLVEACGSIGRVEADDEPGGVVEGKVAEAFLHPKLLTRQGDAEVPMSPRIHFVIRIERERAELAGGPKIHEPALLLRFGSGVVDVA